MARALSRVFCTDRTPHVQGKIACRVMLSPPPHPSCCASMFVRCFFCRTPIGHSVGLVISNTFTVVGVKAHVLIDSSWDRERRRLSKNTPRRERRDSHVGVSFLLPDTDRARSPVHARKLVADMEIQSYSGRWSALFSLGKKQRTHPTLESMAVQQVDRKTQSSKQHFSKYNLANMVETKVICLVIPATNSPNSPNSPAIQKTLTQRHSSYCLQTEKGETRLKSNSSVHHTTVGKTKRCGLYGRESFFLRSGPPTGATWHSLDDT